jgi:hypothetical protein
MKVVCMSSSSSKSIAVLTILIFGSTACRALIGTAEKAAAGGDKIAVQHIRERTTEVI